MFVFKKNERTANKHNIDATSMLHNLNFKTGKTCKVATEALTQLHCHVTILALILIPHALLLVH